MDGEGKRLLAAMLEQDPSKRFKVEWLVKNHPEFNEEFYK